MEVGSIVSLKSGGPAMTVTAYNSTNRIVFCTYYNPVTGLYHHNMEFPAVVLRSQFSSPVVPADAGIMRATSNTARSSLGD